MLSVNKTSNKSIIATDSSFVIHTNHILETSNTNNSIINYSFRVTRPVVDSLYFENFVITEDNNQYNYFILKYEEKTSKIISSTTIDENLITQNILSYIDKLMILDDCIEVSYEPCNGVGTADGHAAVEGYCDGSALVLDFSDCFGSGGGGSDSGSGGDSNDPTTNDNTTDTPTTGYGSDGNPTGSVGVNPPCRDCFIGEENPCENLKDSITFNPQIKLMFKELKTHANTLSSTEKGFKIRKNPANNQYYPSSMASGDVANDGNYHVKIIASSATVAIVHSHPKGPWEMFSPEDILKMADMAMVTNNNNNINPLNLTFFLVVYNSNSYTTETFALRFDDSQSIQNLIAIESNKRKGDNFISDLNKKYEKSQKQYGGTKPPIIDQIGDIYDFLAKNNLNMTIYKAKYSGELIDEWEKINTDLTKEPCN